MESPLFAEQNLEDQSGSRWSIHRGKMLKAVLGDPVLARKGAMVAFQGKVDFHHKSAGGIGKFLKQQLSGEDTPLMTVSGEGDVFFAHSAKQVFPVRLDGQDGGLSVNGTSILAFDAAMDYDVHRVKGAGMMAGGVFNTLIRGRGDVYLTSHGQPLVLDCSERPTAVDIEAAVCWSGNLVPTVRSSMNFKSMLRGGSGEAFQYVFDGPGFVVVQPSEGDPVAAAVAAVKNSSSGGGASSLFSG